MLFKATWVRVLVWSWKKKEKEEKNKLTGNQYIELQTINPIVDSRSESQLTVRLQRPLNQKTGKPQTSRATPHTLLPHLLHNLKIRIRTRSRRSRYIHPPPSPLSAQRLSNRRTTQVHHCLGPFLCSRRVARDL